MMNMPASVRRRRQHRSDDEQDRVDDQHPSLREVLGELHREHRAERVRGVGQAGAEAQRLQAMWSCLAMIGVNGPSAADKARYGTSANMTMAATAGYRPASGPWRISSPRSR